MNLSADIRPLERNLLPANFKITDWNSLEPFFITLLNRTIDSREDLEQWLKDTSELEAVISEDACWRQVRMTCDTENKEYEEAFNYFYTEIAPKMQPLADQLNRKLIDCSYTAQLDKEKYFTYLRSVKKNIDLFREENIPILSELSVMQQQFGQIAGKMTVTVQGKEYTLQQAAKFLEQSDRTFREEVYRKVQERRYQDRDALNDLFEKLVEKRHQISLNAGFTNYRDYKFKELGRFDYTPKECFDFHRAIELHVLPLVKDIYEHHRKTIGVDQLRPWDLDAEPAGIEPLRPFANGEELTKKSIDCFEKLHPFFADCLRKMKEMKRFDLDSRKGKAPGGYNMSSGRKWRSFYFHECCRTNE